MRWIGVEARTATMTEMRKIARKRKEGRGMERIGLQSRLER